VPEEEEVWHRRIEGKAVHRGSSMNKEKQHVRDDGSEEEGSTSCGMKTILISIQGRPLQLVLLV
jgi:hypothetical protein